MPATHRDQHYRNGERTEYRAHDTPEDGFATALTGDGMTGHGTENE
jgi:hypothetical protein